MHIILISCESKKLLSITTSFWTVTFMKSHITFIPFEFFLWNFHKIGRFGKQQFRGRLIFYKHSKTFRCRKIENHLCQKKFWLKNVFFKKLKNRFWCEKNKICFDRAMCLLNFASSKTDTLVFQPNLGITLEAFYPFPWYRHFHENLHDFYIRSL